MTAQFTTETPLWQPSPTRIAAANLTAFARMLADQHGYKGKTYADLHRWSVEQKQLFWPSVAKFCNLPFSPALQPSEVPNSIFPRASWFSSSKCNFAQALLSATENTPAIISYNEDNTRDEISYAKLNQAVANLAAFLRQQGVGPLDRVAGYLPNTIATVVAMLATTSIGATWSSCSPDFGVQGVVDRFGQITPKVLFSVSGYNYNGKTLNNQTRIKEILAAIPSITTVVLCDERAQAFNTRTFSYKAIINSTPSAKLVFEQFPFDHPVYILFSSGTTGVPKCIVHGAGGTLLQLAKELCLHTDLKANEKLLYFTTCGWMMWNWMVSALALKATIVLYDGAPLYPNAARLFEIVDTEKVAVLGISAKYLSAVEKAGAKPRELFQLSSLKTMLSTGSPLLSQQYDFVYRDIKADLCLSSISGGTDIVSCFGLGNPQLPVYRGKLQCRGLGMDVDIFDGNAQSLVGQAGELVCKSPFPSMPIYFWNDPNNEKYRSAYFDTFPGIWRHGDWAAIDDAGQLTIFGRSDATLNPGGVRIGSAELYRVVEKFSEVLEALAIGQSWQGDSRIILFVKMQPSTTLDAALIDQIKQKIRRECSPRHIPAKIIAVPDIPRTISGKIVELAVKDLIEGRTIKNKEALANPQALDYFRNIPELLID